MSDGYFVLLSLLFCAVGVTGLAQDCPAAPKAKIEKMSAEQALPKPQPGKAVLVVVRRASHYGIAPVALDGKWIGANSKYTYFYTEIDPGSHVLCTGAAYLNVKSKSSGARLNAEAGKTYYFEQISPYDDPVVKIMPIDDVQATTAIQHSKKSTLLDIH